jgi:hypothetical protein
MPEITVMCQQGSSALIIVDRIERASEVPANILDQAAELAKCGDKQDRIYEALKKRLSTAKPAVVAVPAAAKAPAPTTAEAPAAPQAPPAPRAKPVAKAKPAAAAKPAPANAK